MTGPCGPDLSSLGDDELADLLENFYPDDALLSSLATTKPGYGGQQGDQKGSEALVSGQAQGVSPFGSNYSSQEGLVAATSSQRGQHGGLLSTSTPQGLGASLPQPALPAQPADASRGAPAEGPRAALPSSTLPSRPAEAPFLSHPPTLAAPFGVGRTAVPSGTRAPEISRHFEAAAAAVAAEGADTPLGEAPEAFLHHLLGADSLLMPELDMADAAATAEDILFGGGEMASLGDLAPLVTAVAAAGPAAPRADLLESPAADLQTLGSGSLPPLPLEVDELFEKLASGEILDLSAAAAAALPQAGLPAATPGQPGVSGDGVGGPLCAASAAQQPPASAGYPRHLPEGSRQQPVGPYELLLEQLGLQQPLLPLPQPQLPPLVAGGQPQQPPVLPLQPSVGSKELSGSPQQRSVEPPRQQQQQQQQQEPLQAVASGLLLVPEPGPSTGMQASEYAREGPTKKQLRARQAQARFREKQKAKRQGLEEGVEALSAEFEREQALRESVEKEHGAMEQLLGYKEGMLEALQEAAKGEEVPPAEPIPPVLRPHTEQGDHVVFPVDLMQRYQVEGDTALRDAQGRVVRAPAFEKVAAEFAHIVVQLRALLGESRKSGDAVMQRVEEHSLAQLSAEQTDNLALQAQQGASGAQQGQQERRGPGGGWRNVLSYAKRCRLARAGVGPLVPSGGDSLSDSPFDSPADSSSQTLPHASSLRGARAGAVQEWETGAGAASAPSHSAAQGAGALGSGPLGAGAQGGHPSGALSAEPPGCLAGAMGRESPTAVAPALAGPIGSNAVLPAGGKTVLPAGGGTVPPAGGGRGRSPLAGGAGRALAALGLTQRFEAGIQPELALRVASATLATTMTLREGSALSMDAQERIYLETLLRRMLVSTTLRGAQPWTLAEGGLLIEEREGPYFFTGAQLRRATRLIRQAGSLLWQQALLFPDNLLKLSAVRIDTGQPIFDTEEAPSTAQWEHLVEHLDLLPSQLADVVAMHAEFIAAVLPARRRRNELLESLIQVQFKGMLLGFGSAQEQAHATLASLEINSHIQKATQEELAAYVAFVAGMIKLMHFPVQKAKLILYSWPYFPQMHLIAQAVRQKLGMDPLAVG